jgi:uncharacterized protein (TIGR02118 family)
MIKVTVLYPNTKGGKFDFDYYLKKHIPMTTEALGKSLRSTIVERGTSGMTPGTPPDYICICHLFFDSLESFMGSFMPVAMKVQGDMPNYTDIEPVIQFSDVLINK